MPAFQVVSRRSRYGSLFCIARSLTRAISFKRATAAFFSTASLGRGDGQGGPPSRPSMQSKHGRRRRSSRTGLLSSHHARWTRRGTRRSAVPISLLGASAAVSSLGDQRRRRQCVRTVTCGLVIDPTRRIIVSDTPHTKKGAAAVKPILPAQPDFPPHWHLQSRLRSGGSRR